MRALCFLFITTLPLAAQPRGSAHYSVPSETLDAGGTAASSANYTSHAGMGEIAEQSSTSSAVCKAGFSARLADPVGLTLSATPPEVAEDGSRGIDAFFTLDDASLLRIPSSSASWTVVSGPVLVSPDGVASGQTVAAATSAVVRAARDAFSADLALTITNSDPDNYGAYAGDSLADDWQLLHFGEDNPLAGPLSDPDGDGQDNRFEFAAGLLPNDAASVFRLRIEPVAGEPTSKQLVFQPRFEDRNYIVETSDSMQSATWSPLAAPQNSDAGTERTVVDPNATGALKFYRVRIESP